MNVLKALWRAIFPKIEIVSLTPRDARIWDGKIRINDHEHVIECDAFRSERKVRGQWKPYYGVVLLYSPTKDFEGTFLGGRICMKLEAEMLRQEIAKAE